MPKELVVVPGAVAKKTVVDEDGYEYPVYEQIPHLGPVTRSLWLGEWVEVRMHSTGVHVCEPKEEIETDSDWEAVVFG